MDAIDRESEVLLPRWEWTRRGFVMTSLITGFALSVQPVSADAIHTDATGLDAGEVKVPLTYLFPGEYQIHRGDRIAQLRLVEDRPVRFIAGKVEPSSARQGGFGSTGR